MKKLLIFFIFFLVSITFSQNKPHFINTTTQNQVWDKQSNNWVDASNETNKHDGNGILIEKEIKLTKSGIIFTRDYKYDENGNLVKIEQYMLDENFQIVGDPDNTTFDYDSEGKLIKETFSGSIGTRETIYTYDGKKLLHTTTSLDNLGEISRDKYFYNADGTVRGIEKQIPAPSNNWVTECWAQRTYDINGNVSRITIFLVDFNKPFDQWIIKEDIVNDHDQFGNLIKTFTKMREESKLVNSNQSLFTWEEFNDDVTNPCPSFNSNVTLCLNDNRFKVEVNWEASECDEEESRIFFFPDPSDFDFLVQILDGTTFSSDGPLPPGFGVDIDFGTECIDESELLMLEDRIETSIMAFRFFSDPPSDPAFEGRGTLIMPIDNFPLPPGSSPEDLTFFFPHHTGDGIPVDLRIDNDNNTLEFGFNSFPDAPIIIGIPNPNPTGVTLANSEIPNKYSLTQNYPNPFNPTTNISYSLPESGFTKLAIYNSIGEMIKTLVRESQSPGSYSVSFEASNLPSGLYIYKLNSGKFSQTQKMMLLK
jgi:Secretion system C-terminal sorting domain